MSDPVIFQEEFIDAIGKPTTAFDRAWISRVATSDASREYRERLEAAVLRYPEEHRPALVGRIRSFVDAESKSAVAELLVHQGLELEFSSVEVEPSLQQVDGKTPDFFVDGGLVVEVASIFERENAQEASLIEALNRLPSTKSVLNFRVHNLADVERPALRDVVAAVREALEGIGVATALTPFLARSKQGIIVTGHAIDLPNQPLVAGRSDSIGAEEAMVHTRAARSALAVKARKYRKLREAGVALVVAAYVWNDWLDTADFDELLYGDKVVTLAGGVISMGRTNALLQPGRHRALSAVAFRKQGTIDEFYLEENEHAGVGLDGFRDPLARALRATPLPERPA